MQVCTSLQTDSYASTPPLSFYRLDALPAAQPTASEHWRLYITLHLKSLKTNTIQIKIYTQCNVALCRHRPIVCSVIGVAVVIHVPDVMCRRKLMQTDSLILSIQWLTTALCPSNKSQIGRISWQVDGRWRLKNCRQRRQNSSLICVDRQARCSLSYTSIASRRWTCAMCCITPWMLSVINWQRSSVKRRPSPVYHTESPALSN